MARMIDADRLLRELTALSHGQVWPGWTYDGIRLLIERQPTLTPPNEWVSVENVVPDPGERVLATDGTFVGEAYRTSANTWYRHTGFPWRDCLQSIVTLWMPLPTVDKDNHVPAKAPNEWVSVEERLPEDEARQFIEDNLDGIGYLYPCLLTYKSPNTERIHVVRFYYDIIQKWFVNNGEELCEKSRCIAWMPLPAPYDRRPPEGETDEK